jgi:hypothetical protein
MATTKTKYTGNGTNKLFSFSFPYLFPDDIKVQLNGVNTTAYTFANATTIQMTAAPANGVEVTIYRDTNSDAMVAEFYPGSAIRAQDLNDDYSQILYVVQESETLATETNVTSLQALSTANAATTAANAATSTSNAAISQSTAAVNTANTASTNASAAVTTANTSSTNSAAAVASATAAVATANSASTAAASAVSTANAATTTANSATTTANTKGDAAIASAAAANTTAATAVTTANNAVSIANTKGDAAIASAATANTNASAAVATSNTASTNASTAVTTANTANSKADQAIAVVGSSVLYDLVTNVAAIPASPTNNKAVEVYNSTGIESFTPLTGKPAGFVGSAGLSARIIYTTTGATWNWVQYFPNDPETRYLKLNGYPLTLPNAAGSSGQIMVNNGSNGLNWQTPDPGVLLVDGGNFANGTSTINTTQTLDGGQF